jgi:hypothetical protein
VLRGLTGERKGLIAKSPSRHKAFDCPQFIAAFAWTDEKPSRHLFAKTGIMCYMFPIAGSNRFGEDRPARRTETGMR